MTEGPSFIVFVHNGNVDSFKKTMALYDVEVASCLQMNRNEFSVTFEEPTTTVLDAIDFFPTASWTPSVKSVRPSSVSVR